MKINKKKEKRERKEGIIKNDKTCAAHQIAISLDCTP